MTGQPAARHAPEAWQSALAGTTPEEAELRLVALAGQAASIAIRPILPSGLSLRPDLPSLALPHLPAEQRPTFRRLMAAATADRRDQFALIRFLSGRGWTAHPFDWMPAQSDAGRVPDVYLPWLGWLEDQPSHGDDDELTEATWDEFFPAERRALLMQLRERDPAAARALIEAKAGGEAAERRLALISVLEVRLSEDDGPFLKSLASDRSGKVKALAAGYLARLGLAGSAGSDERELAEFLQTEASSIINRRPCLRPKRLKTTAQKSRRAALFSKVSLLGLALALDLSQSAVVERWDFSRDAAANNEFFAMLAETAPEELLPEAIEHWQASGAEPAYEMVRIFDRLANEDRARFTASLARREQVSLSDLVNYAGNHLGQIPPDEMSKMPAYCELTSSLKQVAGQEPSAARTRRENLASGQIFPLGLLLNSAAAALAIDELIGAGLAVADPNLSMLRLNAVLKPSSNS